jgi:integration host factor subunit beta
MTKSEFIVKLAEKNKILTESETETGVNLLLQTIMKTLSSDERVEIRGFGSFGTLRRNSRNGRNPKSGEPVFVPSKKVPFFRAGKELRKRVDI